MDAFLKSLQAQVITLQMRLYACQARMQAPTDNEALHDLRIAVRRLRSLLRPLRRQPACAHLEQAAAALGQASGPLRDLEVLMAELQRQGHAELGARYAADVAQGYRQLLDGLPLRRLLILLDDWPQECRSSLAAGEWQVGEKRVVKYMDKQRDKLAAALRDPAHDRHRLRLLIKRVRYCAEIYPQLVELPKPTHKALRKAQGALGDWHDQLQWLARVQAEPALAVCVEQWQARMREAEARADQALLDLFEHYPQASDPATE